MTFLPTLDQARRIVAGNDAFKSSTVELGGCRVHDFGYLLPGYMDFEDPVPGSGLKAYEMRGLTFVEHPDGTVDRHLMLRKFHALNQTVGHMLKDLGGKRIVSVSEKIDGSLVRFIPIGDELFARSKSSFHGPHVRLAAKLLADDPELEAFVREAHGRGLAPIFELVSPEWSIVLPYPRDELILLQMRREADGSYVDLASDESVLRHGPRVATPTATAADIRTLADVVAYQEAQRGVEGLVVMFDDGTLVKAKTRWYDDFHDYFFEGNRSDKKLVSMVVGETMDDAIARLAPDDASRPAAEEAYRLVGGYVNATVRQVEEAVASFEGDLQDNAARKAFTARLQGSPLLGVVMQSLKEPSAVTGLVKRYVLNQAKTETDATRLLERLAREQSLEPSAPSSPCVR